MSGSDKKLSVSSHLDSEASGRTMVKNKNATTSGYKIPRMKRDQPGKINNLLTRYRVNSSEEVTEPALPNNITPAARSARDRWNILEAEVLDRRYTGSKEIAIATHLNYQEAVRAVRSASYTLNLATKGVQRPEDWMRVATMSVYLYDMVFGFLCEIGPPFKGSKYGGHIVNANNLFPNFVDQLIEVFVKGGDQLPTVDPEKQKRLCQIFQYCPGQALFEKLYPQKRLRLNTKIGVEQYTIKQWLNNPKLLSEVRVYDELSKDRVANYKEWARESGSDAHTNYWMARDLNVRLRDPRTKGMGIMAAIAALEAAAANKSLQIIQIDDGSEETSGNSDVDDDGDATMSKPIIDNDQSTSGDKQPGNSSSTIDPHTAAPRAISDQDKRLERLELLMLDMSRRWEQKQPTSMAPPMGEQLVAKKKEDGADPQTVAAGAGEQPTGVDENDEAVDEDLRAIAAGCMEIVNERGETPTMDEHDLLASPKE